MKTKLKTFIIGIVHTHAGMHSATVGKIDAENASIAQRRAEFWIGKKKTEHGCRKPGNNCYVEVREAYTSPATTALAASAEEISLIHPA